MSKHIAEKLAATGQFCTVTFVTKDGTEKTINGRTGVKKYLKGGSPRTEQTEKDYILIWTRKDSRKFDAPRNVRRDKIVSIKAHGIKGVKNEASDYSDYI